jgi:hypothetical protein
LVTLADTPGAITFAADEHETPLNAIDAQALPSSKRGAWPC